MVYNHPPEGWRDPHPTYGGLYHPNWAVRLYDNSQPKSSPKFLFFSNVFPAGCRYLIYWQRLLWGKMMLTLYAIFGMMVGFEGFENGKVYVGVYTPNMEYGYVITKDEIYLDTIFEKY